MREIAGINYCGIKDSVNKCQGIIYINIILSMFNQKRGKIFFYNLFKLLFEDICTLVKGVRTLESKKVLF